MNFDNPFATFEEELRNGSFYSDRSDGWNNDPSPFYNKPKDMGELIRQDDGSYIAL